MKSKTNQDVKGIYSAPHLEVVDVLVEQNVLQGSGTTDAGNDWDMHKDAW
jgi:hypothetical protein